MIIIYKISKILSDELELLPDFTDTPLWSDYNEGYCNKNIKSAFLLYQALSNRENYFQLNTPTMYGDPRYEYYCGLVSGILQAIEAEETTENNRIVIRKKGRKIMIVDKVKRPQNYYDAVADNRKVLCDLGF